MKDYKPISTIETPEEAYRYALVEGPHPKLENLVGTDVTFLYLYGKNVVSHYDLVADSSLPTASVYSHMYRREFGTVRTDTLQTQSFFTREGSGIYLMLTSALEKFSWDWQGTPYGYISPVLNGYTFVVYPEGRSTLVHIVHLRGNLTTEPCHVEGLDSVLRLGPLLSYALKPIRSLRLRLDPISEKDHNPIKVHIDKLTLGNPPQDSFWVRVASWLVGR